LCVSVTVAVPCTEVAAVCVIVLEVLALTAVRNVVRGRSTLTRTSGYGDG